MKKCAPETELNSTQTTVKKWSFSLSEAKENGFVFVLPPPSSLPCFFCKKQIEPQGILSPFPKNPKGEICIWCEPACDCDKAVEERKRKKAREEELEEQKKIQDKIKRLFSQSNIGERFKQRTFENFQVTKENKSAFDNAKKYSEVFGKLKNTGRGIFFTGPVGTGKTHLSASIHNYLINKQTPVIFDTSINLLGKIKQTYGKNQEEENKIISLYSKVDLLIIDDLGKEKPSFWVLEKLYEIINNRYEAMRPMVITSNFSIRELEIRFSSIDEWIAKAITSRISENCSGVVMNGEDWRMK